MNGSVNPNDADILILGAGVSGLAAAARLTQSGCSVHVLEARDRIGGRILTVHGGKWPVPIDLGAEFVHGYIPALLDIAHAAQLPVIELSGAPWLARGGTLSRTDDFYDQVNRVILDGLGAVSERDLTVAEILAPESDRADLARGWIEAYDAAHVDRLSARSLQREHEAERQIAGDRSFRLVTGYDGIPLALEKRISPELGHIHLGEIATQVHWSAGGVSVETHKHQTYTAKRLVNTLPIGVLKGGSLRFVPELPDKRRALEGLEMGNVVKLTFAFRERFWADRFGPDELGFLVTPGEPVQGWWTGYPLLAPLLIAWAGGPAADALAELSMDQRVDLALDSLCRSLGLGRRVVDDQLVTWASHDWGVDPFARGAYSYVRAGGIPLQALLAQPVADTLFFAGEATELSGHQATVHGALFAGERAATEVLESLGSLNEN